MELRTNDGPKDRFTDLEIGIDDRVMAEFGVFHKGQWLGKDQKRTSLRKSVHRKSVVRLIVIQIKMELRTNDGPKDRITDFSMS